MAGRVVAAAAVLAGALGIGGYDYAYTTAGLHLWVALVGVASLATGAAGLWFLTRRQVRR
jgi:hypothetical protein